MIWTVISGILIFAGIVGTVVPLLPGPPLVLGGLLVYGLATDFVNFSGWVIGVFIALTMLTFCIDVFAPALGASKAKASRYSVLGAIIGVIFGVAVFGPVGIVLGPLVGAFVVEYFVSQNFQHSLRVARGALVAFLVGTVVKLGIVFSMAGYFVYLLLQ